MKKIISILLLILIIFPAFTISYDDNEYQRKSRAYTDLANKAYDEGDYDAAVEYAKLAEENAQKSADFIQFMLAKTEAEQEMNKARTRYTWSQKNNAEERYPEAYSTATEALDAGTIAFDNENFDVAVVCAHKVLDALSVVEGEEKPPEFLALPSEYTIRTWRGERDCLWNIAADPAIYNDPFMWRKLYEANKHKLPDPKNPNWVEPGIILTIPSIRGEKRSGMWDPAKSYQSLPKK